MTFDLETQINIHRNIAISKVVSKLLSGEKGQTFKVLSVMTMTFDLVTRIYIPGNIAFLCRQ